jgi:sugar phosphate isomerase/epimerase
LPDAEPSPRARELVRGAYDLHVHVEPDLAKRRIDDLALARRFAELGLAGFVLKSHYTATAERAAVVRAAVPGVDALGAIVLNAGVGGLNAQAVEIAAREGARIVWLPTVDAENEAVPHEGKQPVWRTIQQELEAAGAGGGPVRLDDTALDRVLAVVARHGIVLSTGHLGRAEISAVFDRALAAGVASVVVTHPDYPSQGVPVAEQQALAAKGALLERCFAPIHTGKVSWEQTFEAIRATGAEHNVLSTDLGQPANPPVEDGLALMADRLLAAGFPEADVRTMAVVNTRRLAGAG